MLPPACSDWQYFDSILIYQYLVQLQLSKTISFMMTHFFSNFRIQVHGKGFHGIAGMASQKIKLARSRCEASQTEIFYVVVCVGSQTGADFTASNIMSGFYKMLLCPVS